MEDKWINYDDEEAEVQLELADLIFDKLVTETTELVMGLKNKNGPTSKTILQNRIPEDDDTTPQDGPYNFNQGGEESGESPEREEDSPEAAMRRI